MAETIYYPATTTISAISFTGINQISGTFPASANVQVFTSTGPWTKPAQSNVVVIECWGGGGGGGPTNGGGGGGGAYVQRWLPGPLAPGPQTVTVGAQAAAAVVGNPSSVGTLCVAYGGKVGPTGPVSAGGAGGSMDLGGTQGFGPAGAPTGGAGGAATFYGGGGGGGGSNSVTPGGAGGSSVWGGGGGGGGGGAFTGPGGGGAAGTSVFGGAGGGGTKLTGNAGQIPGGGGGGGTTGGSGASGYVRITSF